MRNGQIFLSLSFLAAVLSVGCAHAVEDVDTEPTDAGHHWPSGHDAGAQASSGTDGGASRGEPADAGSAGASTGGGSGAGSGSSSDSGSGSGSGTGTGSGTANNCGVCDRYWQCSAAYDEWVSQGTDECVDSRTGTTLRCDGTMQGGGTWSGDATGMVLAFPDLGGGTHDIDCTP